MGRFDTIARVRQMDLQGRRVLVRGDLDVPRSPQGAVLDDAALRQLLPTLRQLLGQRAKVVVAASYSGNDATHGVAARLGELLGLDVIELGAHFEREVRLLTEGQLALTPSVDALVAAAGADAAARAAWAAAVAASFDVYLLDGLRAARGSDALLIDVPRLLPSRGAGPLLSSALDAYRELVEAPEAPYALVLGGASLPRLLPLLRALLPKCSDLLLGGAVANTFLVAQGWKPGGSLHEASAVRDAVEMLRLAAAHAVKVHLPIDVVVRVQPAAGHAPTYTVRPLDRAFLPQESAVDLAIETCNAYRGVLSRCVSALWVGVVGDCSVEETQSGSLRVGRAVSEARRAFVAGEDTVPATFYLGLDGPLRVVAGGDAVLALLADQPFGGLDALRR